MAGPRTCGANFEALGREEKPTVWTLTIVPPTGGSILAAGGIQCGAMGTQCSAELPDGVPVTLHQVPDDGFTFVAYTNECAPSGQTMMTGPRTCSATFMPASAGRQAPGPAPGVAPRAPRPAPSVLVDPPQTKPTDAPQVPSTGATGAVNPPTPTTLPPAPPAATTQTKVITPEKEQAPAPMTNEQHARAEIPGLFKEYCAGLEALDPGRIQRIYPTAPVRSLQEQFRYYKTLKCTITGELQYAQLDADAGTAKVEVGVKQVIEMKSSGAPRIIETIATTTLARPEARSLWRISIMNHRPKPKE
jgi:hypothetical protein